jgi:hypothetical protein
MSDLHGDKKATYTKEESKRHENALDRRRGPPVTRAGRLPWCPHFLASLSRVGSPPPLRSNINRPLRSV